MMDGNQTHAQLPGPAQLRVIALAMLAAPILFGGVVVYLRASATFGGEVDIPYFDVGAAGFGVLISVVAFAVRGMIFGGGAGQAPALKAMKYASGVLTFFALLEGAMLLNLVVALLVATPWVNVGVIALAFALAATSLPSEEQRENAGLAPTPGFGARGLRE